MKAKLLLSMCAAASLFVANAEEARLLRFPATNGTDIAFTYAGDIFTAPLSGGEAKRLTSHNGYEVFARFSPDGNTIAFTGQYDGNTEVYLMPKQGGAPKRITYTATNSRDDMGDRMGPNNIAMAWTPDGKGVVYRNRIGDGFDGRLWIAPTTVGMPSELPLPEGGFCCYSPDGKRLAYNRVFREFRTWKHYKGGMADDIWIYDFATKKVENITNNVAQDIFPMWIGDEIYFASDRGNRMNLYVYNTATRKTEQVTDFKEYDVKFPSCGGGMIVFENGGYLYSLNPKTKQYSKITITLNSEDIYARTERKNVKDFVNNLSLSDDGKRLVITARGDLFDVPVTEGVTKNITRTSGVHERGAMRSSDGKTICYISDETGETELWLRNVDGSNPVQLTSGNDTYITDFEWSNDDKHIVYADRKNRVFYLDVASRTKQLILQDTVNYIDVPTFSPDNKWLTYTRSQGNSYSVVYLYNIAQKKEYAVTERWYDSSEPTFSTDGKYLFFSSARDFNPIYNSIEWNFAYRDMQGIYLVPLAKGTPSPFLYTDGDVDSENAAEAAPKSTKKAGKKKADSNAEKSTNDVVIDIDGITERITRVPGIGTGYYYGLSSDGKWLYFNSRSGAMAYNIEEQSLETVVAGGSIYPTNNLKKSLVMKGGNFYVIDTPRGKANLGEPVDMSNMYCEIDYSKEWAQIFNEAWRAYRDGFYLENMHGVDWKAMHDRYAALLPYVKNRLDLTYVIGGLISELACGHAYVDGGDCIQPKRSYTGMLGAKLSLENGFYRIDKIYEGAPDRNELRSPLKAQGLNIKEGDYITAINGVSTASVTNIYALLAGSANVLTEITINNAAAEGGRKVVIKPIADEYPLIHHEWIMNNIKRVNELSNGRIGYVYIPDMGVEGLKEFSRYFYAQIDKEALIIDDRGNGGGNISPMVIERLLRQPYRMNMYRGLKHTNTVPDKTQYGPKALLVNKYSASDGDLFPWSFKENKIGPVIGTRSWGGIIGITSSLPYIDGTQINVPFFTNYDMRGHWIVENHGVDPDILLDNDPAREYAGEDQQLDKAIEVLLEQLKDRKPLPGVPAPRTLKDLGVTD